MAHRKDHKKHDRRVSQTPTPRVVNQETQPRSIDTGKQMRDPLRIARADEARRFVERVISSRLETLRRLETEDLRRNRREIQDIERPTYRRADGRRAEVGLQQVRKPALLRQRVPEQVRYVFRGPRGVLVCQRRRARRAVIFALQLHGQGKGASRRFRKARWSESSYIVCRKVR